MTLKQKGIFILAVLCFSAAVLTLLGWSILLDAYLNMKE